MSGLSHFWQRFVLGAALLFGLLLGVAATVFGYSNTATVDVGWSVWRLDGVPLWTVAIVPLAVLLVAGALYHWYNSFHHFTEHMRHRRRVHELEDEVTRLRTHLDHLLEMPGTTGALPARTEAADESDDEPAEPVPAPAAPSKVEASGDAVAGEPEPADAAGTEKQAKKTAARKRSVLAAGSVEPSSEPPANGSSENGAGSQKAPEG